MRWLETSYFIPSWLFLLTLSNYSSHTNEKRARTFLHNIYSIIQLYTSYTISIRFLFPCLACVRDLKKIIWQSKIWDLTIKNMKLENQKYEAESVVLTKFPEVPKRWQIRLHSGETKNISASHYQSIFDNLCNYQFFLSLESITVWENQIFLILYFTFFFLRTFINLLKCEGTLIKGLNDCVIASVKGYPSWINSLLSLLSFFMLNSFFFLLQNNLFKSYRLQKMLFLKRVLALFSLSPLH